MLHRIVHHRPPLLNAAFKEEIRACCDCCELMSLAIYKRVVRTECCTASSTIDRHSGRPHPKDIQRMLQPRRDYTAIIAVDELKCCTAAATISCQLIARQP